MGRIYNVKYEKHLCNFYWVRGQSDDQFCKWVLKYWNWFNERHINKLGAPGFVAPRMILDYPATLHFLNHTATLQKFWIHQTRICLFVLVFVVLTRLNQPNNATNWIVKSSKAESRLFSRSFSRSPFWAADSVFLFWILFESRHRSPLILPLIFSLTFLSGGFRIPTCVALYFASKHQQQRTMSSILGQPGTHHGWRLGLLL